LFVINDKADVKYDCFDANKMFSQLEITELYFVAQGITLVKEEVNTLPCSTKLNVKSCEKSEINLKVKDILKVVAVFLIDNGNDTRMNEGEVYNTYVVAGENADRFQLLIKKQHRLQMQESKDITIKNNNREISIITQVENLNIEVYNALG
jgi:hypothetical protein